MSSPNKLCTKCQEIKELNEFSKSKSAKDGLCHKCKACFAEYHKANRDIQLERSKKWYEANKEAHLASRVDWRKLNKDKITQKRREIYAKNRTEILQKKKENRKQDNVKEAERNYMKNWRKIKKHDIKEYEKLRYANVRSKDVRYVLSKNISNQIRKSLHGQKSGRRWEIIVGFSAESLKEHLTKTMPEGYEWNDYICGKLHIDHIIPVSAHNFQSESYFDFKMCWSLKYLRLLPASENCSKGNRIDRPFQPSFAGI